ncbi:MAG TPA: FAD binding domain-containing protein [Candidatus Limnocylindrales bacterium]|nr:FAD binding domain-containing protein [Candidatus Limnocylindrales bacterium]
MPIEPPIELPRTLADAYAILAGAPHRPIAGGTDVMVQITGELGPPPERMIDLARLDDLRGISLDGDALVLGALTTYTEIRRSALCREHLPALVEAAATIGAAQIQNRGTLGGNAVNASPAGDTLPVLLATDARLIAGSARGEREIPATGFWTAYRRTALEPDELLLRIRIPLVPGREVRFRKVGTRRAQAISKVVLALAWREAGEGAGGAWRDVRLGLGSVADRPIRAAATEAVVEGAAPTAETADRAAAALAAEIHPIDDVRSTADYRRAVAARVLHRLIRDAGGW